MNREEITRMARKAGIAKHGLGWTCWEGQLERFAALITEHEREACAKLCDDWPVGRDDVHSIAVAIRARGEQ
jgi:hypothetical protein